MPDADGSSSRPKWSKRKKLMTGGVIVLLTSAAAILVFMMNGVPISLDRQAPVPPSSTDTGSVKTAPVSPGMVAEATRPPEVAMSAKKAPQKTPKAVKKAAPASSKSAPATPVEAKADEAAPTVKPSEPATPPVPKGMASSSPADEELLITSTKSEPTDAPKKASDRFHVEADEEEGAAPVRSATPAKAKASTGHEWESNDGAPEVLSDDVDMPDDYPVMFKANHNGTHIPLNGAPTTRITIEASEEILSGWNSFPAGEDLGQLANGRLVVMEGVPEGEYHFNIQGGSGDFAIERITGKTMKHNFVVKVNGKPLPPGNGILPKYGSHYDHPGANLCVLVY